MYYERIHTVWDGIFRLHEMSVCVFIQPTNRHAMLLLMCKYVYFNMYTLMCIL